MNVIVILSGIADPKWPLPAAVDAAALAAHRAAHPLLSPFDEAALELALKLRDAAPDTRIRAFVRAAGANDPLLRHVAGFRLERVEGLDPALPPAWNAAALARALAATVAPAAPDLVLLGREFGDEDDGSVPALLAPALGMPFVSQALRVSATAGGAQALRQHGPGLERLAFALPAVVAVTNHTGNRLRQPLLKNVMAARRMTLELAPVPAFDAGSLLQMRGLQPIAPPQRTTACRMIEGDARTQADALARLLCEEAQA